MGIAQRRAGFNPAVIGSPGTDEDAHRANVNSFNEYVQELSGSPLFTLSLADTLTLRRTSKDFNVLVDEIAGLFQGIAVSDVGMIRQGLVSLAKAAISRMRTQQRQFLFTQSVLQCYGNLVEVSIYSSYVSMYADSAKGATTTQAEYQVNRRKLGFRTDLWPDNAEMVWNRQTLSIRDWINANTTISDPQFKKRLCIDPTD